MSGCLGVSLEACREVCRRVLCRDGLWGAVGIKLVHFLLLARLVVVVAATAACAAARLRSAARLRVAARARMVVRVIDVAMSRKTMEMRGCTT